MAEKTWWLVDAADGSLYAVEASNTASALAAARKKVAEGLPGWTAAMLAGHFAELELDVVAGSCTGHEVQMAVKAQRYGDRGPVKWLACRWRCQRWKLNTNQKRALARLTHRPGTEDLRVSKPETVYPALVRRDLVTKVSSGWMLTAAGWEVAAYLAEELAAADVRTRPAAPRPLYVIVHCARRATGADRVLVHDVHPDDSLEDVTERAAVLQAGAHEWGRERDTYRVAQLTFIDREEKL
jgi:hypothetical protein